MKNEREIAELIFDKFRSIKCKTNERVIIRTIRFGLIDKLNPKEKELFDIVFVGLQVLDYFTYEKGNLESIRLTKKGYDYIYDDEKVEQITQKPWVIPEVEKTDWEKAYNRLWKIIGPQEGAIHYIGGSQFYKFVFDLCDDIPPTYSEFIEQRREKELSTSRSVYYKDLIDHLDAKNCFELYVNIQLSIETESKQIATEKEEIEFSLFDNPVPSIEILHINPNVDEEVTKEISRVVDDNFPKVLISYSWDTTEHEAWVLNLAEKLRKNGVDVILDKWDLGPLGKPLPNFMENAISTSNRVICVMTPNYKTKTDKSEGGVGYEYSIITANIFADVNTSKFIPLIRQGLDNESVPTALLGRKYLDMRKDEEFDSKLEELLRDIHKAPINKKPTIGPKPIFE